MSLQPLRPAYEARRLPELIGALLVKRQQKARDSWSRTEIEAFQRRRLAETVAHAVARSPIYRELYGSTSNPERLEIHHLPVVTKDQLMDRFDDWVTDPRLTLSGLETHLAAFQRSDGYYLGRYRALTTSGSSGRKGVFVFTGREWRVMQAQLLRFMDNIGVGFKFRPGPRMRCASIFAGRPLHIASRLGASLDVGATRILRPPATTPLPELVEALNAFQPEWLHAYPSIASLLADEQMDGRLRISPRAVSTVGELRTEEMTRRITSAWGAPPFDMYWMTEGGVGMECENHRLHAVDDEALLEIVDEDNRPVPPGEPGKKLLVTNFYMRTQPVIRFEISDMLTLSPEPCPCGRPYPVLSSVDGRSDDVVRLPDGKGGWIPVHPVAFRSALATEREARQYQVVHRDDRLLVRLIPADGADREALRARVAARVMDELASAGAGRPELHVELVETIARHPQEMGKLKLIRSEMSRT